MFNNSKYSVLCSSKRLSIMSAHLTSISTILCLFLLLESGRSEILTTFSSSSTWNPEGEANQSSSPSSSSSSSSVDLCRAFEPVENGYVEIRERFAEIKCKQTYYLDGPPIVSCFQGKWMLYNRPKCIRLCYAPPSLVDGSVKIDGEKDTSGLFRKGAVATYACHQGFKLAPKYSGIRVCDEGIWRGPGSFACSRITNCLPPKNVSNGYFVHENKFGELNDIGQRLHYNCKTGFKLEGAPFQLCLEDGTWSPKKQPECFQQVVEEGNDYPCTALPKIPHSEASVVEGSLLANTAEPQTVIEFKCINKYRNVRGSCKKPTRLTCINGRWVGLDKFPYCLPVHKCEPPPTVPDAAIESLTPESYESTSVDRYALKSQIIYQCLPGYNPQGSTILTCAMDGCWTPEPPTCVRMTNTNYFMEVNSLNAILISTATGAGVLGLLLVICLIAVCRRRKPLSRSVPISPPVQRIDLGDHATLLAHPDRLALIAFADGMQNDQGALPSYDEATRDRAPGLVSNRLHRPHWPVNLGGRRARNNADMVHVTRHGSFASHTPSTRSAADSMGSTDTMAVSEGSTNVTLDTASSHSGSQPASCRVHCGSLASFDTSSVINTEGVPLLEESELEEIQGADDISLVMDNNPSICDNASFKLSTHSADLP